MIVDGKAIASRIYKEIQNEVTHMSHVPHLTVFTCAPNFETQKYLALKRRKAHEVGISVNVIEFPSSITTEEVITSIAHAHIQTDGIIVQLPFPPHIAIEKVLEAIPKKLDVDAVLYDGTSDTVLPPVVGAIQEIAKEHDVLFATQQVVIVGKGRLVGAPSLLWCQKQGAQVTVIDRTTPDKEVSIASAHILILGAGSPGLITPSMIAPNVLIFDAGTSEEGGVLKGDADPSCASKASLFTPVPGGIGPITIAILLRNLIILARLQ
jgi:methylenetetrahydrofolate dehydrogenase (NADP+)/methenyltetrahydrofolate cyclohydrolase